MRDIIDEYMKMMTYHIHSYSVLRRLVQEITLSPAPSIGLGLNAASCEIEFLIALIRNNRLRSRF